MQRERIAPASLLGAPFSLVTSGVRDDHKRRQTALLSAVADENVEIHNHLTRPDAGQPPGSRSGASSCRSEASDHAA